MPPKKSENFKFITDNGDQVNYYTQRNPEGRSIFACVSQTHKDWKKDSLNGESGNGDTTCAIIMQMMRAQRIEPSRETGNQSDTNTSFSLKSNT